MNQRKILKLKAQNRKAQKRFYNKLIQNKDSEEYQYYYEMRLRANRAYKKRRIEKMAEEELEEFRKQEHERNKKWREKIKGEKAQLIVRVPIESLEELSALLKRDKMTREKFILWAIETYKALFHEGEN